MLCFLTDKESNKSWKAQMIEQNKLSEKTVSSNQTKESNSDIEFEYKSSSEERPGVKLDDEYGWIDIKGDSKKLKKIADSATHKERITWKLRDIPSYAELNERFEYLRIDLEFINPEHQKDCTLFEDPFDSSWEGISMPTLYRQKSWIYIKCTI